MERRGVSTVVATVLIILVCVVGVGVIWLGILSMVGDVSDVGSEGVRLEIVSSEGYTVWDSESRLVSVQVERIGEGDVCGLGLVFVMGGNSVTHFVDDVPSVNGRKVYYLNLSEYEGVLEAIRVAPVFCSGKVGDVTSELRFDIPEGDLQGLIDEGVLDGDDFVEPSGSSGGGGGSSSSGEDEGEVEDFKIIINSPGDVWSESENILFDVFFNETLDNYGFVDFEDSLVGWWRGEDEGMAVDESGRENNCDFVGDTTIVPGKFGSAYSFDGDGDYISCYDTNHTDFQFNGDGSFSISFWSYTNEVGGYFLTKAGSSGGYKLYWHDAGPRYQFMAIDYYTGDYTTIYAVNADSLNKWTHVSAVYDAVENEARIYVNGVVIMSSVIKDDDYLDIMLDLKIGWGINGMLDEILIFNRSLSDEEVFGLYDVNSKDLVREFDLVEGESYSYKIYGVNSDGIKSEKAGSVLVDVPNSAPNVVLTSPINNTRLSGNVLFECDVKDTNRDSQLASVSLYWDSNGNFEEEEFKMMSDDGKIGFSKVVSGSVINWNCYACDDVGNCGFAEENNRVFVGSNDYYVATDGVDSNSGTLGEPFLTIQKCADIALPGDTCYVRAGTYREEVTPKYSGNSEARITFKNYNDEEVVISGADVVGGWTQVSGEIYKADMNWDLGRGKNQVFVDKEMMFLARFPNTPSMDVMRPVMSTIEDGVDLTGGMVYFSLNNSNLTQGSGFWDGAIVFYTNSPRYNTHTGIVDSSAPGGLTFYDTTRGYYSSSPYPAGGAFQLSGIYSALDSEGEWFFDNETQELYLWQIGGGVPSLVEVKSRQLAFNLSGKKYITIEGFDIFSSGIYTNRQSNDIVIDSIDAKYVSHHTIVGSEGEGNTYEGTMSGVMLDGYDNVLKDSRIQYSSGNGVGVRGERNKILNSEIYDVNYNSIYCGAVKTQGPRTRDIEIIGNKLYNSGRDVVQLTDAQRLKLFYNEMFNTNVGLLTSDLGVTYANSYDYDGSEIAYNTVYDSGYTYAGIYFDYRGANIHLHHNLVYGVKFGMLLSSPQNYLVEQNTIDATIFPIASNWWVVGETPGDHLMLLKNNIFTNSNQNQAYMDFENNIYKEEEPFFVDRANHDYHLRDYSPAIDAGLDLGYSEDIEGNPVPRGEGVDIGAYESDYSQSEGGVVSYYEFLSDAMDSIGNYNGTLEGDAVIVADPVRGNVLSLDGSEDYVNLPTNVLAGRNMASLGGWFKTTDVYGSIIMQYDNGGTYIYLLNIYGGKVEACMSAISMGDCSSPDLMSPLDYNDGEWHHAIVVSTGSEVILYVDAVEVDRISKNVDLGSGSYINTIGLQGFRTETPLRAGYFEGLIDDVRVYGRVLSSEEITAIFNA